MTDHTAEPLITVEQSGHVLLIGLNRPEKRNAFTTDMLQQLGNGLPSARERPRPAVRRPLRAR